MRLSQYRQSSSKSRVITGNSNLNLSLSPQARVSVLQKNKNTVNISQGGQTESTFASIKNPYSPRLCQRRKNKENGGIYTSAVASSQSSMQSEKSIIQNKSLEAPKPKPTATTKRTKAKNSQQRVNSRGTKPNRIKLFQCPSNMPQNQQFIMQSPVAKFAIQNVKKELR